MLSVDHAIEVLNRIHQADPTVMPALIFQRVPCNETLADDKTVQVGLIRDPDNPDPRKYEVGILGILNGIFGVDDNGYGFIYANFDDQGNLVDFSSTPIRYCRR
jgi:hypothetical protein